MLRLDPSCAVFTSSHLLLVRLCLEAKAYSCALPVLNKQICHFPISLGSPPSDPSVLCADHGSGVSFMTEDSRISSKLSYRDYLQYFLYGGMVYMALKEWRNALHFLGIVISTPSTNSVSLIMVEAYKKWVLVSLLEKGKVRYLRKKRKETRQHCFLKLIIFVDSSVRLQASQHLMWLKCINQLRGPISFLLMHLNVVI